MRRARAFADAPFWEGPILIERMLTPLTAMRAPRWDVPAITTRGELAEWLGVSHEHLSWLADEKAIAQQGALAHYRCEWAKKKSGGHRLLEAPKPTTKALQRRILHELLDRVPPHDAAHGFRAGRSVLTHANAHAGWPLVVRLDLEDFFPSIGAPRVRAMFRAATCARATTRWCAHARVTCRRARRRHPPSRTFARIASTCASPRSPRRQVQTTRDTPMTLFSRVAMT